MSCRNPEISEQILAWIDGVLPREDSKLFSAHIETCDDCKRDVEALKRLTGAVASAMRIEREHPIEGLCPTAEEIVDHAAGTAPPQRYARVEAHARICADCAEQLATLRDLEAAVPLGRDGRGDGTEVPMPGTLRDAFRASFPAPMRRADSRRPAPRWGLRRLLAAAAMLAVLIGVTALFITRPEMLMPTRGPVSEYQPSATEPLGSAPAPHASTAASAPAASSADEMSQVPSTPADHKAELARTPAVPPTATMKAVTAEPALQKKMLHHVAVPPTAKVRPPWQSGEVAHAAYPVASAQKASKLPGLAGAPAAAPQPVDKEAASEAPAHPAIAMPPPTHPPLAMPPPASASVPGGGPERQSVAGKPVRSAEGAQTNTVATEHERSSNALARVGASNADEARKDAVMRGAIPRQMQTQNAQTGDDAVSAPHRDIVRRAVAAEAPGAATSGAVSQPSTNAPLPTGRAAAVGSELRAQLSGRARTTVGRVLGSGDFTVYVVVDPPGSTSVAQARHIRVEVGIPAALAGETGRLRRELVHALQLYEGRDSILIYSR